MDDLHCELLTNPPTLERLRKLVQRSELYFAREDRSVRQQSKELDQILGLPVQQRETELREDFFESDNALPAQLEGIQTWIGLHPQVLQTPYSEIAHFFSLIERQRIRHVIDLGAGYGRVGVVMQAFFPDAWFSGHEIVPKRLSEARHLFSRLKLDRCQMLSQDILASDFVLPDADLYFIYDFGDPHHIRRILKKLSERVFKKRFFLVAKGKGIRSLINLKFPEFWAVHGAIHRKNWSLYSSFCNLEELGPKS